MAAVLELTGRSYRITFEKDYYLLSRTNTNETRCIKY